MRTTLNLNSPRRRTHAQRQSSHIAYQRRNELTITIVTSSTLAGIARRAEVTAAAHHHAGVGIARASRARLGGAVHDFAEQASRVDQRSERRDIGSAGMQSQQIEPDHLKGRDTLLESQRCGLSARDQHISTA